jgi:putative ABC transport system substrate-binding protein
MRRREFITLLGGVAAAWPVVARGQQSGRIARIGILSTANPRSSSFYQSFEQRLRDLGHIEGQNIVFEYRNAEGEVDRLPDLAAELARLDPSIIVSSTAAATSAVKRATSTIPILVVAVNYDPIALGYVGSLARPGGNVTGLFFQHLELSAKRFGLLKELLPSVAALPCFSMRSRLAILEPLGHRQIESSEHPPKFSGLSPWSLSLPLF